MSLKVPTPAIIESTCLRVSQLVAFWYASARASKYKCSECDNSLTPRALFIAVEEAKRRQSSPALSGVTLFSTVATISVALLVWRCLVRSEESLQESHGFPSGSSLHAARNSLSFSRGSCKITGVGSSLWVEAVLILSGDRKVSSAIVRRPRLSANSSTDWLVSLYPGDEFELFCNIQTRRLDISVTTIFLFILSLGVSFFSIVRNLSYT